MTSIIVQSLTELRRYAAEQELLAAELTLELKKTSEILTRTEEAKKEADAKVIQSEILLKARRAKMLENEIALEQLREDNGRLSKKVSDQGEEISRLNSNVKDLQGVVVGLKFAGDECENLKKMLESEKNAKNALVHQIGIINSGSVSKINGQNSPLVYVPVQSPERPQNPVSPVFLSLTKTIALFSFFQVSNPPTNREAVTQTSVSEGKAAATQTERTVLPVKSSQKPLEPPSPSGSDDSLHELLVEAGLAKKSIENNNFINWQERAEFYKSELEKIGRAKKNEVGVQTARIFLEICSQRSTDYTFDRSKPKFDQSSQASLRENKKVDSGVNPHQMFYRETVQTENVEISESSSTVSIVKKIPCVLTCSSTQTSSLICRTVGSNVQPGLLSLNPARSMQTEQTVQKTNSCSPRKVPLKTETCIGRWETDDTPLTNFRKKCENRISDVQAGATALSEFADKIAKKCENLEISNMDLEISNSEKSEKILALTEKLGGSEKLIEALIDKSAGLELEIEKFLVIKAGDSRGIQTEEIQRSHKSVGMSLESTKNFRSVGMNAVSFVNSISSQTEKGTLRMSKRLGIVEISKSGVFISKAVNELKNKINFQVQTEPTNENEEIQRLSKEVEEVNLALSGMRTNFQVKLKGLDSAHKSELARITKQNILDFEKYKDKISEENRLERSKNERSLQLKNAKRGGSELFDFIDSCIKWVQNGNPIEHITTHSFLEVSVKLRGLTLTAHVSGYMKAATRLRLRLLQVKALFSWRAIIQQKILLPSPLAVIATQAAHHQATIRTDIGNAFRMSAH